MKTYQRVFSLWIIIVVVLSLAGCSRFRGSSTNDPNQGLTISENGQSDHESELIKLVERNIRSNQNHDSPSSAQFISKKPNFFKEYVEYPQGADEADVEIRERDSRSIPYQALVHVSKVRYATSVENSRDKARKDSHYLKSTGTETISYEYRSGNWYRLGSFFVAKSTEVQTDGEWKTVDTTVIPTIDELTESDEKGFWSRLKIWQR